MPDLVEIAEKLTRIKPGTLLFRVLSRPDVQAFIINLNTEDQLKTRNEDALGVKLADNDPFGGYSVQTQFIKNTGKRQVTLFDTGDYYESFAVIPLRNFSFNIESNTTIHGDDLKDRWGDNIEGLNNENLVKVNEFLEEKIIEEIERLLQ
tara:strand:+ start:8422 stop:8871 length:450 start_codon:yes stop_codon:yes gene_type:complete